MQAHIKLGKVRGIEIGLHYSWFIIAALIALSLSARFHTVDPGWTRDLVWAVALTTAFLFFVTLLLHELAHSLLAKARGLKVRAITLFALGGVSQIESEAENASSEFWIAIVGPITSAVIGYACILLAKFGAGASAAAAQTPVAAILLWLGYINIALAVFNMIPGYPLDGGRVLRSIIWWITGKPIRATQMAARVGQVIAVLFILYGLFRFFFGGNIGGLWLVFIGWFLIEAAKANAVQAEITTDLRGRTVADVMERDCEPVEGYLSLRDFVDQHLLHSANRCFPVVQGETFTGLITPAEVRTIAREDWAQTSVQSVMRPLTTLRAVPPEMPAMEALQLMARENLNALVVVAGGHLQGVFSHAQIARFLQVYSGHKEARKIAA